jgi:hypothetical protein
MYNLYEVMLMNIWQKVTLWIVGCYAALVFAGTGVRLIAHAEKTKETLENGYPFTVVIGTAWAYIIPIIIVGGLIVFTMRDHKKK